MALGCSPKGMSRLLGSGLEEHGRILARNGLEELL